MTQLFTLILSCSLILHTATLYCDNQQNSTDSSKEFYKSGIFISDWESVSSWEQSRNNQGIQYSLKRELPLLDKSILEEGVVLVFTKGYSFSTTKVDKPLSLPFYFFMDDEKAITPIFWSITPSVKAFEVDLHMTPAIEKGFLEGRNAIQLRYFLLDKGFLKKHKLSPQALRNMSYQQVVALLAVSP